MTDKQANLYRITVRRLARMGVVDPTAQIVSLAEEIEHYRNTIRQLEAVLDQSNERKRASDGKQAKITAIDEWKEAKNGSLYEQVKQAATKNITPAAEKSHCWHASDRYRPSASGVCWGTIELDPCRCEGDPCRCDFYPEVRERAKEGER